MRAVREEYSILTALTSWTPVTIYNVFKSTYKWFLVYIEQIIPYPFFKCIVIKACHVQSKQINHVVIIMEMCECF